MSKLYFLKKPESVFQFFFFTSILSLTLLLGQVPAASAQWTRQQNAFKPRAEMMNVLYQDRMYSFGGIGTWPYVETTPEMYDPALNKWTLLAPMPAGKTVTHQGIAVVDDQIWHIGGRLDSTLGSLTSEVWIYNITRNNWTNGPELKHPVTGEPLLWGGGGAALIGRTIHVVGGFVHDACRSDQSKYHLTLNVDKWLANPQLTTWENKMAPLPVKRNHFSTMAYRGKMYVLGGQFGHDCGGGQDQKYSHVYDPLTNKWTRLTDLPMVRSHCEASTFVADEKIYLVSGDGGYNKVTRFNPDTNGGRGSWTDLPSLLLPQPFTAVSAKVVGDKIIVAGGRPYNKHLPLIETYSAPFARQPTYKLGFLEDCFTRTVETTKEIKIKNILYTLEGEKQYRLSTNASWLKITRNAAGTTLPSGIYVEALVRPVGLAPGSYQATITAKGVGSGRHFNSAQFCVNLKVTKGSAALTITQTGKGAVIKSPDKKFYVYGEKVTLTAKAANGYNFATWSGNASGNKNPLNITIKGNNQITANFRKKEPELTTARINAGGSTQTVKGLIWRGCPSGTNCNNYVEKGNANQSIQGTVIKGASYNNLNQNIYQTEWTSNKSGSGRNNYFIYRVPVKNGKYLVQLYFVESSKNRRDAREFDVRLEGKVVLPNFDIFAAANGKNKVIVRSFPVTITDRSVRIDFINRIDKAKVNAIAIIPYKNATLNKEPVAKISGSRVVTANAKGVANVTLSGSSSYDTDGYLVLHQWHVNNQYLANGLTNSVNLKVGTHQIKLLIKDNARATHTVTTTITVKASAVPIKPDSITTKNPTEIAQVQAQTPLHLDSLLPQEPAPEKTLAIRVFPNPGAFGDKTVLELSHAAPQEEITVTIYDMAGQLIHTNHLKPDVFGTARTEYPLTGKLSAGTYLIRAHTNTGSVQTKLVVQ